MFRFAPWWFRIWLRLANLANQKQYKYNTISFIEDDKNKDREVSADTAGTETYYMMGSIKNLE